MGKKDIKMNALKSTGLVRNAYLILCNFTVMRGLIIYTQNLSNNLLENAFANYEYFSFLFLSDCGSNQNTNFKYLWLESRAIFFLGFSKAEDKKCMSSFSPVVAGTRCLFVVVCLFSQLKYERNGSLIEFKIKDKYQKCLLPQPP